MKSTRRVGLHAYLAVSAMALSCSSDTPPADSDALGQGTSEPADAHASQGADERSAPTVDVISAPAVDVSSVDVTAPTVDVISAPAVDVIDARADASDGSADGEAERTGQLLRSETPRELNPAIDASNGYTAFVHGANSLGFELFHKATSEDGNAIFSPASVAIALGMAYVGARGTTASEMRHVLHDTLPADRFPVAANRLLLDLASRDVAPHGTPPREQSVRLSLVDSLWGQSGYPFEQAFLDTLAVQYGNGVHTVDFIQNAEAARLAINGDVARSTEQRVSELIPPGVLDAHTRLVLTNTVYLKSSWAQPFANAATWNAAFHSPNNDDGVPTMHGDPTVPYAEDSGYQMIALPYDGGQLEMDIVLPAVGQFSTIRNALSADWFDSARAKLVRDRVTVAIPKVHFAWGTQSLVPMLKDLGMLVAFDGEQADFSGIGRQPLFISDVLHKAFVDVDESGTEAAAATAVIFGDGGAAPVPVAAPTKSFIADRPFLFVIRDSSGAALFVGQVVDPRSDGP